MATKLLLHLTFFFFLSLSSSSQSSAVAAAALSFSIPLVRHQKFSSLLSKSAADSMTSVVLPNTADHLMQFSIGTPPVKVLAVIDTGSDLIWSRCKPCSDCAGRTVPAFDPELSSTYKNLPCNSTLCQNLNPSCSPESPACNYTYGYGDGSFTKGILATETLTFESVDGGSVSVPDIGFGCGHNDSVSFDGHQVGLVGLGGQPTSLISQLGPSIGWKFSYCLVPFHENSSASYMTFGDKAAVENAVSTPLVPKEDKTYYYVTLESITVGDTNIDASATGTGNMFIDSGTTVTLLNTKVFDELADAVAGVVGLPRTTDAGKTFACYNATSRDGFPDIGFGFAGGADLLLRPANAFTPPSPDGLVCLAMQATEGAAVFGNQGQQNFHVGYDLVKKEVAFAPAQCSEMLLS